MSCIIYIWQQQNLVLFTYINIYIYMCMCPVWVCFVCTIHICISTNIVKTSKVIWRDTEKKIKRQTSQVGIFLWTVSSPSHFSCCTLVHATWHRLSPSTFFSGDGAGVLITALVTPETLREDNRWEILWRFVFVCWLSIELSEQRVVFLVEHKTWWWLIIALVVIKEAILAGFFFCVIYI